MAYDVFLAYRSADLPAVESLANKLHAAGVEPFLDRWHLIPGQPWQEGLEEALEASRTCAVFLGTGDFGPWQHEEMRAALDERARNQAFRVIPVLLPGAPDPDERSLPRFLRQLGWVRFSSLDDEGAYHRFLCGIRGVAPGPEASGPGTTPTTLASPLPTTDNGELAHVRELVEIHQKRRRVLEKQAALKGSDAPPHVVIELEEVAERIDELQTKLRQLTGSETDVL